MILYLTCFITKEPSMHNATALHLHIGDGTQSAELH